jgi:hypothetical protein
MSKTQKEIIPSMHLKKLLESDPDESFLRGLLVLCAVAVLILWGVPLVWAVFHGN